MSIADEVDQSKISGTSSENWTFKVFLNYGSTFQGKKILILEYAPKFLFASRNQKPCQE